MVIDKNSDSLQVLTAHASLLGEGPVWDARNKRILWVDILSGEIHSFVVATGEHRSFKTGQMAGAVALCSSGLLIAALQDGFTLVNLETGSMQWLADPESDQPDNRFNDGKCDPAGRFWAGTMSLSGQKGKGNLYALGADHKPVLKIPGVSVSNGLGWSPNHNKFYFIDTATNAVAAYDYDQATGDIRNKTIAVSIPAEMGKPDGMTVDADGMLWIAIWNGWCVTRWDPETGQLLQQIKLPVARVTSCTFGGNELKDLYITTAKTGLSEEELKQQPFAGCVFVYKNIGVMGVEADQFPG